MADKVVLAYSGGLDTSVAIKWLQEKYNLGVIAVTIDVGNEKDFSLVRKKAMDLGALKALVIDAKDDFIKYFAYHVFDGFKNRFRFQYHPRTTTVRVIIYYVVFIMSIIPDISNDDPDLFPVFSSFKDS